MLGRHRDVSRLHRILEQAPEAFDVSDVVADARLGIGLGPLLGVVVHRAVLVVGAGE